MSTLYACLSIARKAAPEMTLTALLALLFIARETGARDWKRIPTVKKIAEELGLTTSGTARIVEVLSEGRTHGVKANKGLGLIISAHMFEGRAAPYFLSPKGVVLIKQMLNDLAPGSAERFQPYDEGAMLLLAVAKASKHADYRD